MCLASRLPCCCSIEGEADGGGGEGEADGGGGGEGEADSGGGDGEAAWQHHQGQLSRGVLPR